jgi:hypothetical protein
MGGDDRRPACNSLQAGKRYSRAETGSDEDICGGMQHAKTVD